MFFIMDNKNFLGDYLHNTNIKQTTRESLEGEKIKLYKKWRTRFVM